MQPRIETLSEKKLVGKRMKMSLSGNLTFKLWQSFMSERKQITNNVNRDLISMQIYHEPLVPGNPNQEFDNWAAVEVTDFETVPDGMEVYNFMGGLYAIFAYKGLSTDTKILEYIFAEWLPASDYELNQRPHLGIMGAKYRNNDPDSEEEICIPVKRK